MLSATLGAAYAAGLTRIELEVVASNAAAIALYERGGFAHDGRKRAAPIVDNRVEDLICMAIARADAPGAARLPFAREGEGRPQGREADGNPGTQTTRGLRVFSPGNRPKSRSAVHNSVTPCCWQSAATLASCTSGPPTRPVSMTSRSFLQ